MDTLLLVGAAILCMLLKQYLLVDAWVTEKLLALFMYVFMVTLALKIGHTRFMRSMGLVGALSWITCVGMVVINK